MSTAAQFMYDNMVRFIRLRYPNAVPDAEITWYKGKAELDFLPHPRAIDHFACVLVPGHELTILREF